MSEGWEGLLLIDKPAGPTSHDVVDRVRRIAGIRRVGHAGTLDPAATGLLPVVLGRATRLTRFLPDTPKVYSGTIELGRTTDTDDASGTTLERHEAPLPGAEEILRSALALTGRLLQVPPRVSARKIEGRRMYEMARRGIEFVPRPAEIEVFSFDLFPTADPAVWGFEASVSPGTYIRSLARDLGGALGCGATLGTLRRTRIGPFEVARAEALPEISDAAAAARLEGAVIPLELTPLALPELQVDAAGAARFALGQSVPVARPLAPGELAVRDPAGRLLGIGEPAGGAVRPRVVLARPSGAPLPD